MCVCIMVLLTACGAPKPEETVAKYLDLAKKADYTAMKELVLTDGSKAQLEALAAENEDTKELTDYIKECGKKIEYKIVSTKIDNFNATVQVSCRFVDGTPFMSAVISDVIKKTLASAGNKLTEEEINKMYTDSINEQLSSFGIPTELQAQQAVQNGSLIWVNSYTREDGTQVCGYYRRK